MMHKWQLCTKAQNSKKPKNKSIARHLETWYIDPVIRKGRYKQAEKEPSARINDEIRAQELRVIGADGANLGVISKEEALKHAQDAGFDLIEISPNATPPVARIQDYGKFQYAQKKKQREIKAKSHVTETKTIQIKIGTGEHDLALKGKRVTEWLTEGHRVKIDLFLRGRSKYMEQTFLKDRLHRFLNRIDRSYKIADEIKKGPKGLTVTIEPAAEDKQEKKEAKQKNTE